MSTGLSTANPTSVQPMETTASRLLARPVLQEYDAFHSGGANRNPAESGNLAARHKLVKIAEACRKEADVGMRDP